MMNQQSQAQSQAQTQAQIAALREQNAILNQQLTSQAQSHIQHLQQLLPLHQPPPQAHAMSTPPTPQPPGPQVPDPPTPVAPTATQAGSNPSFNPEEMMQQMKNTVESSMKAFVDKTQERNINPPPAPTPPITPIHPHHISHFHPPAEYPTSSHRSQRSESRRPDKRPVSIPRSPRRHKSSRKVRRSSRPRSSSKGTSSSRYVSRRRSRATTITLRSASPHRREGERHPAQGHQPPIDHTHPPANLQPALWEHHPQQSFHHTNAHSQSYQYDHVSTNQWQPWGQWKDSSKSPRTTNPSKWIDYPQPSDSSNDPHHSSTKPLTAFSSDHTTSHRQKKKPPHTSSSEPSRTHGNFPPGHVAINLQEGSKEEWFRSIKYALHHPERMKATSEIPSSDRPQPSQTMDHQAYEQACETLSRVDNRIPPEVIQKAVKLLFSTYLLPDYDLTQAQIHELTSTNMLALVLPLPDSGHFQMPPPFRKRQTHTYALFHGTSLRTSQLILLEGKIRPANWSYHKNLQRCDMPTFGAFFLGREVSNSDKTIPEWVARELLDTIQKKGKGQQEVIIGAMYRGAFAHTAYKAGGDEMAQLGVADKGIVTTSEKYTIAHSNHVGLKFVALKWQNLIDKIDLGASSSEDLNYLSTEDRYSGRR